MQKQVFLLLIIFTINNCPAQYLARTVIGSQGDFFWSPSVTVEWTVGEVMSETFAPSGYFITQGFHQPNLKVPEAPGVDFEFFNGFSPNGDGLNDLWTIPFLVNHPINTVIIINRWGSEVWMRDNYDNKQVAFRGDNMNGNPLPDGTYYYIIQYNKKEKRGWVFIKR